MPREQRFTFVVDKAERRAITELAERLKRSESDAVRWVVTEAARELALVGAAKANGQEGGEDDCTH
jgi:hypothetical protein